MTEEEQAGEERVKYVKRANAYCRTTFIEGKQVQEWTKEDPRIKKLTIK